MGLTAVMFPGQGAQFVGMGANLFAQYPQITQLASNVLGFNVADVCTQNTSTLLFNTRYTQPCMYVVNYLHYCSYKAANGEPDFFTGHSLGEFNALQAAGAFSFETGLSLVKKRGELMNRISGTGMAAVIGANAAEIEALLINNGFNNIDIANHNLPEQIVVAGPEESLQQAAAVFEDEGFAFIRLKVSGGFHSRYMTNARLQFGQYLNTVQWHNKPLNVIANATGSLYPAEKNEQLHTIVRQIDSPVLWHQGITHLLNNGVTNFVETGPGNTLTNIVKRIVPQKSNGL